MKKGFSFQGFPLACIAISAIIVFGCLEKPAGSTKGAVPGPIKVYSAKKGGYIMSETVTKTNEEWKKILTPEQYHILREKGTERAYSGIYASSHEKGTYCCAGCGLDLYRSEDKYESGTGWPSFTKPISPENISTRPDNSFFSHRTEVICRRCEGHLGHVFDDGPKPTGLRYCMNSAALQFVAAGDKAQRGEDTK